MGIQQDKICQGNRHGQAIFANPLPSGSLWQFNIAAIANWKITEFSNGLSNIIYQWAIFQFANSWIAGGFAQWKTGDIHVGSSAKFQHLVHADVLVVTSWTWNSWKTPVCLLKSLFWLWKSYFVYSVFFGITILHLQFRRWTSPQNYLNSSRVASIVQLLLGEVHKTHQCLGGNCNSSDCSWLFLFEAPTDSWCKKTHNKLMILTQLLQSISGT